MFLIGRKAICQYLGCTWKTIKNRKKRDGLPIRTFPPDKPLLDTEEFVLWVKIYNQVLEKLEKEEQ